MEPLCKHATKCFLMGRYKAKQVQVEGVSGVCHADDKYRKTKILKLQVIVLICHVYCVSQHE